MSQNPLSFPLPAFVRLRITGDDRARFLHNFCTNDINGLANGSCCEVFFTNVKARILAHGFLLAAADHHEIWMLPGDEETLQDHLNRYIITEDVTLQSLSGDHAATIVVGSVDSIADAATNTWQDLELDDIPARCVTLQWNQQAVHILSSRESHQTQILATLSSNGAVQVTAEDFDRLRIASRIPLIGQDLDENHLAPEAARNASAISYTKGCYLGQEPIARLDALGQVNRALASVSITSESSDPDSATDLTSFCDSTSPAIGLAVVKADCITSGLATVRAPDGRVFSATVTQPRSLTGD